MKKLNLSKIIEYSSLYYMRCEVEVSIRYQRNNVTYLLYICMGWPITLHFATSRSWWYGEIQIDKDEIDKGDDIAYF